MRHLVIVGLSLLLVLFFAGPVVSQTLPAEEATLITGLDGGTYEPYSSALVQAVQKTLRDQGIYEGEITGKLDEATMKAIGEFQKKMGSPFRGFRLRRPGRS